IERNGLAGVPAAVSDVMQFFQHELAPLDWMEPLHAGIRTSRCNRTQNLEPMALESGSSRAFGRQAF
ncbi:hypothetical protein, partial [Xanthomonas euvesicatoria]|uniref:hypothetical protein n=1 Tax=Xanthomonas euvesicatoria TaxID=456327 RepID=UPI0019D337E2